MKLKAIESTIALDFREKVVKKMDELEFVL